ncbi:ferredoxin--NADP reductase [soil metagenome]
MGTLRYDSYNYEMTSDDIAQLRAARYNATVVSVQRVHSDLVILRIKPDFPRPAYKAGQYCSLGLGYWEPRVDGCQPENLSDDDRKKVVARAYSVSSSIESIPGVLRDMTQDDWVEFYVVLVRENLDGRVPALTPRLFALEAGSRLKMFEKFTGHYTLDPVKDGNTVIFLGTGTGEAPHNAMLWELLNRKHSGRILHACCVRYRQDLGYMPTHIRLMSEHRNYTYLPLTTRESVGHGKVYIQDLLSSGELEQHLGQTLDPARTHVYLCGNPKMIGIPEFDKTTHVATYPQPVGVIELLAARGFTPDNVAAKLHGNIHFEKYW